VQVFFVHFIEIDRQLAGRVPKSVGRNEIEEREYEADDKCAEEKIPEENDFVASRYRGLPGAMIYF
jgi:hypothetical protein